MGKYAAFLSLGIRQAFKNYKSLIGLSVFLVTSLLIFSQLWKITAAKIGATNILPSQLLWYIAFNEWVLIAIPDPQEEIQDDYRSGRLAYLLPRPISYMTSIFFESLGTLIANLIALGFVAFLFTAIYAQIFPFNLLDFLLMIFLGLIAGSLAILFQMAIGISSFWFHEVGPFYWMWEKLLYVFGGLMLPLAVYPVWLQKLAYLTPFPLILGGRSALAIQFEGSLFLSLLGLLFLWGALACGLLYLLYKKGLKILNIEGG